MNVEEIDAYVATYRKLTSCANVLADGAQKAVEKIFDGILKDLHDQLVVADMGCDEETIYDTDGSFISKTYNVTIADDDGNQVTLDECLMGTHGPLELLLRARDFRAGLVNDGNHVVDDTFADPDALATEAKRRIPLLWDQLDPKTRAVLANLNITIIKIPGTDGLTWDWS